MQTLFTSSMVVLDFLLVLQQNLLSLASTTATEENI